MSRNLSKIRNQLFIEKSICTAVLLIHFFIFVSFLTILYCDSSTSSSGGFCDLMNRVKNTFFPVRSVASACRKAMVHKRDFVRDSRLCLFIFHLFDRFSGPQKLHKQLQATLWPIYESRNHVFTRKE